MKTQATHTAGPMTVMFGGYDCSLHLTAKAADANAKNRILQLPRSGKMGDVDPNVQFLYKLATAEQLFDALKKQTRAFDLLYSMATKQTKHNFAIELVERQLELHDQQARAAIARATGGAV